MLHYYKQLRHYPLPEKKEDTILTMEGDISESA